ncbi:dihydropteroate synthase [Algoriphagus litoralis]|uniref:dihydropteroate synthase n=1 Tax=Algoriphagus litoralis TaxID=2202829 RepID=UPI0029371F81|nr:dihydropteroate synthase [Algoriphagus litoralis]
MGILNLTPDSFYESSRVNTLGSILSKSRQMISEGADFLDLGGYSTRPGATDISIQEEIDRVAPAIEIIRYEFPHIPLSVDTFRSKVALEAVNAGATLVNDISAGELDPDMLPTIARLGVPYIAMHMKGNPQNMQSLSDYSDICVEILHYFAEKVDLFTKLGIKDVIIDPGFGFAKTTEQNFFLLKNLRSFEIFGLPLLVGISRKSMIYKTLQSSAAEALNGTTALNMVALMQGANLLRVHDVKEAKETINLYEQLYP